ncbi:putative transposase [Entamoeba marina]
MDSTIPVKQIQNIIAKKKKMALGETEIEYTEEDLTNPEFINSKSIELSDDEIKLLAPSISSIRHFLKGETGSNEERNIPMFSFKKETIRGFVANTEENKIKRIEAIQKLRNCIAGVQNGNGIRLTSVCAIDSDGFSYCNIVAGSNTKECFESYFKRLMNIYDSQNRKCVFWCDNCSIHNSMNEMVEATQHLVIYNAAYSPELNPIENIFGIWKIKTEKQIRGVGEFARLNRKDRKFF